MPFDVSIHNHLLRAYVAEAGLDPDRDIQLRSVPPPEMVANLRADNIDGSLGPDPFNQRAVFDGVGFLHLLTRELRDGHPCCAFAVPRALITEAPRTCATLLRAIVEATAYSDNLARGGGRDRRPRLPQSAAHRRRAGADRHLRGRARPGAARAEPDRLNRYPWHSMAIWIPSQMRRWGQLNHDVDWCAVAEQTFLALDAGRAMRELGLPVPDATKRIERILLMTNGPRARIAEVLVNTLLRPRERARLHHVPGYHPLRDHIMDFLITRSRSLAGAPPPGHDPRHPPVVRPAG